MKSFIVSLAFLGALNATAMVASAPVAAQQMGSYHYDAWQPLWDQGQYDHKHIVIGHVVSFSPYRLTIRNADGAQTVDLKPGTIIRPRGTTPSQGERVAMIGYWSGGTFIVNRLVVRM